MEPMIEDELPTLFNRGSDTSEEAAESIAKDTQRLRRLVYEEIRESGGLSCDEIEERLGMKHQTCSARVHDLHALGRIRDSGMRRKTRSGRNAIVWVLV